MSPTFRHAVASFDPTETAVLLWTRLAGGRTSAELTVATDPGLHDVVHRSTATTGPERDHTIVVDVDGLAPATTYWYRFTAGDDRSPVGRTATLPPAPVERFRLGLVCCARYSVAPLGVYRALAEREVDLVLHLGDYMYEDAGHKGCRPHDPPWPAVTIEDYRRRLAQLRADPDTQALHVRHPMTSVWDDHDLADNAWRDGAKHHDPATQGDWHERSQAAARARQEWLPARLVDPADPLRTWRSFAVGDLAEIVLLDARLTGRDRQAGDGVGPSLDDPRRSLLGDEQRAWLHERLRVADQPWAVVVSGVVVNSIELSWPAPLARVGGLLPSGYAVIDGRVLHDDQWDGYPAERDQLAGALVERGRRGGRTILLSGDVHSSWAFVGPRHPPSGTPVATEFTIPAVSSAAMGRAHYPGLSKLLDAAAHDLTHVAWSEVTERGYGLLEVTPREAQVEWWFVHPFDERPADTAELGKAFVVPRDAWPPRLDDAPSPLVDPERTGLPEPLPERPADLRRLRWRHRARIARDAGAVTVSAASAAAALAWAVGRGRRGRSPGLRRRLRAG
jgi:alkaline phosphatase D